MKFKVHNASGFDTFEGGATYTFNEAGLLVVHIADGGGRLTYSPQAWKVVEEPGEDGKYLQGDRFSRK
ncbi:MAG: hypothetical protein ACR2KL_06000 [Nocardioidaceae bacterium]